MGDARGVHADLLFGLVQLPHEVQALRLEFRQARIDRVLDETAKRHNEQWQNPRDPDAKIGRTKDGATDMVYLPEHTVDLLRLL